MIAMKMRILQAVSVVLVSALCCGCVSSRSRELKEVTESTGERRVSLSMQDTPVSMVLKRMSSMVGTEITTCDEWLAFFPVSITVTNATVGEALSELLGDLKHELLFERDENTGRAVRIVIDAEMPGVTRVAIPLPDEGGSEGITVPAEKEPVAPSVAPVGLDEHQEAVPPS